MATTTAAAANTTTLSMKLLVDTKAQRVLFAEASKDVVDFFFSLLSLPVATAVKLLGKDSIGGSVGNLYSSVEKLDVTYVQPGAGKDALLKPVVLSPAASTNVFRLTEGSPSGQSNGFFRCSYGCAVGYISDTSGVQCPTCGRAGTMTSPVSILRSQSAQAAAVVASHGFVQPIVTYTVLDNLTVTPMSSIVSSIAMLNTFAVKDLGALQEKTVRLGFIEGLAILRASLQSKTVLTDVFLGKNRA